MPFHAQKAVLMCTHYPSIFHCRSGGGQHQSVDNR